jgi:hypothetical protein
MGFTICTPDGTDTMCGALPLPPEDEVCNGDDDDCDGEVDNDVPGVDVACQTQGQGACGPGETQCIGGDLLCIPFVEPGELPELCDGLDNNCNGIPDEGWGIGDPCDTNDSDFCARGKLACNPLNSSAPPICQNDSPTTFEVCNGRDDDCDFQTDELWNFLGDANNCNGCGQAASPQDISHICSSDGVEVRQCISGACIPECDHGRQNCDHLTDVRGSCESNRITNPACPTAYTSGTVSGDVNRDHVFKSGYGEARYRVRVREDSDWIRALTVGFILTSPNGVNFDICVRCNTCGNSNFKCSSSTGRTDAVYVSNTDYGFGGDDSFDAWVEIFYTSGDRSSCGNWSLLIDSDAFIPDGAPEADCD